MHAQNDPSAPSADTVKGLVLELAPLLIRAALSVTVGSNGIVEVRNPRDTRMKQPLVLREHQNAVYWHWVWSGPTPDAPPELEPMVPAGDVDEAARRIVNVLRLTETVGGE